MTDQIKRYRVPVDFPEQEREILTLLCTQDFRPPEDQIRYLVIQEGRRRGLFNPPSTSSKIDPQIGEGAATPGSFGWEMLHDDNARNGTKMVVSDFGDEVAIGPIWKISTKSEAVAHESTAEHIYVSALSAIDAIRVADREMPNRYVIYVEMIAQYAYADASQL